MNDPSQQKLSGAMRDVVDFPKEGIIFKDITPVLSDAGLFQLSLDLLEGTMRGHELPSKILGIDARGFIFGAALAARLGCGFVPIRKKGKLPWRTMSESYKLEYGESVVEMHEDAIASGERVWLVDDLLATGGTAEAALKLARRAGAEVIGASFFVELCFLEGRAKIGSLASVHSVLQF